MTCNARLRKAIMDNFSSHPFSQPGSTRKALNVRAPLGRNRASLTERPWLIDKFAMRGELTVLIAPPGAGKTTLMQQVMHAASAGLEWGGFATSKALKVMVFHWEDDEQEMDRKVQAIEGQLGTHPHPENLKTVYCGAGDCDDDDLILATYEARSDAFTPTLGFDEVDSIVGKEKPDIVCIDPLANTFEGPEGNELLKKMARLMRRLARKHNIAVVLILHTKKYADGMAGNMDAGRNAGTLVGRVRVGLTLFPMTEEEADAMSIERPFRYRYVRLDDGKQSYGRRDEARWFEIVEMVLRVDVGDEEREIRVGTFEPWEPQPLFHGISMQAIHAILREIDRGVLDDAGTPTGDLYQPRQNAAHWAGDVIIRFVPGCSAERAKRILAVWKRERLLVVTPFKDRRHRNNREGLKSDPSRWPGNQN